MSVSGTRQRVFLRSNRTMLATSTPAGSIACLRWTGQEAGLQTPTLPRAVSVARVNHGGMRFARRSSCTTPLLHYMKPRGVAESACIRPSEVLHHAPA